MNKRGDYGISCGCMLIILILNLFLGGWSVNYILALFGKALPTLWAVIVGLFVGEFTVPVAIVVAILRHFGIL